MSRPALFLLLAMLAAAAPGDHEEARRLLSRGAILPLEEILESARRHQPGDVLDVELEQEHGRHVYEILLLDGRGRVWELELDAATGELIDREAED